MLARAVWFIGMSMTVLAGVEACGSDASTPPQKDHEDASTRGSGGSDAGGMVSASGGAAGQGGTPNVCDTSACEQQLGQLNMMLGGAISFTSCCVDATTCGIDLGALAGVLGTGTQTCIDPSSLTLPPSVTTPPITELDGGIIPVPDGGQPILLDPACPTIDVTGMPGCCRPSGTCGASTHTIPGAGTTVLLECASYDEIATSAAANLPGVVIPDDPNIHCDYTLGHHPVPVPVPDAGADSGPDTLDSGTGTGTPDAALRDGGHPDASSVHKDAGKT
jgi:hypothetical protein